MTISAARGLTTAVALAVVVTCCDDSNGSPSDASTDSPLSIDGGHDAPTTDAPIEEVDSGPIRVWAPSFPARRVFYDSAVNCPVLREYVYSPPARSTTPGDLEWSTDPLRSPEWAGVIPDSDATRFEIWQAPFTLLSDGGTMAIAPAYGELGFRPEGGPNFYFVVTATGSDPYLGPHLVLPDGRTATERLGRIWIQDPNSTRPAVETLFARVPEGNASLVAPAVTAAGEILWAPDDRAVAANCIDDGRPRWVVEVDPHPSYRPEITRPDSIDIGEQWRSIHVTDDGGIIFLVGPWLYRFDRDGQPVAEIQVSPDDRIMDRRVWSLGLDPICGVAVDIGDRLQWHDPDTLALRSVIRYAEAPGYRVRPLHDCSVLQLTSREFVISRGDGTRTRLTPSFSASFAAALQGHYDVPLELSNGDLLLLMIGRAPTALGVAVYRRGMPVPVLERLFGSAQIGAQPVPEAYHVTLDGSLRIATSGTTGWRVSSIDIGAGPALPLLGRGTALDPMHTNSLWASEPWRGPPATP